MFAYFRNSVGVINVRRFEGRLKAEPRGLGKCWSISPINFF